MSLAILSNPSRLTLVNLRIFRTLTHEVNFIVKRPLRNGPSKGKVPSWMVNASVKTVGPIIVKRLYQAARTYAAWKANHDPDLKPWSDFHQMQESPPLDPADVGMLNSEVIGNGNDDDSEEEVPDESSLVPSKSGSGQSINNLDNSLPLKGLNMA